MSKDLGIRVNSFELKLEITRACNLRCSFCYLGDTEMWRDDLIVHDLRSERPFPGLEEAG